jgi:hypothetical protein
VPEKVVETPAEVELPLPVVAIWKDRFLSKSGVGNDLPTLFFALPYPIPLPQKHHFSSLSPKKIE